MLLRAEIIACATNAVSLSGRILLRIFQPILYFLSLNGSKLSFILSYTESHRVLSFCQRVFSGVKYAILSSNFGTDDFHRKSESGMTTTAAKCNLYVTEIRFLSCQL